MSGGTAIGRLPLNVNASGGTLYVATPAEIAAFPATASGTSPAPLGTLSGFYTEYIPGVPSESRQLGAIGIGGGSSLLAVMNWRSGLNDFGCSIDVYSPDATGNAAAPQNEPYCNASSSSGITGDAFGRIDYIGTPYNGSTVAIQRIRPNGSWFVRTNLGAPGGASFAEDASGNVYVSERTPPHIAEFPFVPLTTVSTPTRSAALTGTPGPVAVAQDGTVFVATSIAGSGDYVYAYPLHGAKRTIGPFTMSVGALAFDNATCELFVGLSATKGKGPIHNRVKVFAETANGASNTQLRSIDNPIPFDPLDPNNIVGLAILAAPPAEELYVGTYNTVQAFPIDATGTPSPTRTITGLGGTPNGNPRVGPIAVSTTGALAALETGTGGGADYDLVVVKPFDSGAANVMTSDRLQPGTPSSVFFDIGVSQGGDSGGGVDTLANGAVQSYPLVPQQNSGAVAGTRFTVPAGAAATSDADGNIYVAYRNNGGGIAVYAPYAQSLPGYPVAPVKGLTFSGVSPYVAQGIESIAVARDGTVYVSATVSYTPQQGASSGVLAFAPSSFTASSSPASPSRTLLVGNRQGASIAVDRAGELFVSELYGVMVYAPTANGNDPPIRSMYLNGSSANIVDSIAVGP